MDVPSDEATSPAAPVEPVAIHDVVPLVQGAQRTWSFDIGPNATQVEVRFFATGKAVVGGGMPTCVRWEGPKGSDAAGQCIGPGQGNVIVSPSIIFPEGRTYFALGADAPTGHYTVSLDSEQSAADFHAVVIVAYD